MSTCGDPHERPCGLSRSSVHVYEVHTLAGAITLALSVAVLVLGNCYLVRITGRLTPGTMVHATDNGLALLVALALVAR